MKMIHHEEEKFLTTLIHGESLLKTLLDKNQPISGDIAFKLYDTFGFPVELTKEIAQEAKLDVDLVQFESLMDQQRERARQARHQVGSMAKQSAALLGFKTPSQFLENPTPIEATVIGIFQEGEQVTTLTDEGEIILDQTTFYAESGGQTADIGMMVNATTKLEVLDVQKAPHKQHLHKVSVSYGSIKVGDRVRLEIKEDRRRVIQQHHSSLHLLQAALKKHLGDNIIQQGSFVGDSYARFDFSHHRKITDQELMMLEEDVNQQIQQASPTTIEYMPIDQARLTGATAPFEEKYGDIVRIVTLGPRSKEFCGGTHVSNTLDIGMFAIVSEESIAAGTRRLVVVSGAPAYAHFKQKETMLVQLRTQLGATSTKEIFDRLKVLIQEKDQLKTALTQAQDGQADGIAFALSKQMQTKPIVHGFFYEPTLTRPLLLKVMDRLKATFSNALIIIIGKDESSFPIGTYVGASLQTPTFNASIITKQIAVAMQGSGGGKSDIAFGAGKVMVDLATLWKKINL
jgi:alanyl-tRNA synthetase